MRRLSMAGRVYLALVAFSWFGSALTMFTKLSPGPIAPAASVLTILFGVVAIYQPVGKWASAGAVLLIGFIAEVLGLYTGLPFGRYAYTSAWWPTIPLPGDHRFPLMLPFAWMLMAGGCYLVCARYLAGWTAVPVAGLMAAILDIPMEPVMTNTLGYWRWLEPGPLPGGAPWMNFVGWFLVATLASAVMKWIGTKEPESPDAAWVLAGHMVLLLGLALFTPGALRSG